LEINGYNVSNFSKNELCEFWNTSKEKLLTESVNLVISDNGAKRN